MFYLQHFSIALMLPPKPKKAGGDNFTPPLWFFQKCIFQKEDEVLLFYDF